MFKDFLKETLIDSELNELEVEIEPDEIGIDYSLGDLVDALSELTQEELNEVGDFILAITDDEDLEENLNETKYFDTTKRKLARQRKIGLADRRRAAKLRKKYYKKNKARIKRKQKLYKKKVKNRPSMVTKHRK
jgi:hypothetical protein